MAAASFGFGWTALSRALSYSAPRAVGATLVARSSVRATTNTVDFVGNTTTLTSDPAIFEDTSDEYVSIADSAPPPTPPILSLIEASLPLRLPEPAVSDTSVFEEFSSDDYAALPVPSRAPPSSVVQVLNSLIPRKRYFEAYHFCLEMASSGIDLPRSGIYERVARAAISKKKAQDAPSNYDPSKEEILNTFTLRLSMLPCIHEQEYPHNHKGLRREVFQTLFSDIAIPLKFSVVMAEKGYAELLSRDAIPYMLRFASRATSLRFIEDFLQADLNYFTELAPERKGGLRPASDEEIMGRKEQLAPLVQGRAIEILAQLEDFQSAFSLLPTPETPFRLSDRTYKFLCTRMSLSRVGNLDDHIAHVEKLVTDPKYCFPTTAPRKDLVFEADVQHLEALKKEYDPRSYQYIGEELAAQLQALIGQIQRSELSVPLLVDFLSRYYLTERTTAIHPLRILAFRRSRVPAGQFLYAEMAYYHTVRQPLLVLRTFANNFYLSGVAREEIDAAIRHGEQKEKTVACLHPAHQTSRIVSRRKLWATRAHSDLAWHALAMSVPVGPAFESLYDKFMEFQTRKYGNEKTLLKSPAQSEFPVGGSVFAVYFKRLLRSTTSPSRPTAALRDMMLLGFHPTIHHYTILALFYASIDDIRRTFQVVNALEAAHPVDSQESMVENLQKQVRAAPGIPVPDVKYYAGLIRVLVVKSQLQEALEIEKFYHRRFTYQPSVHEPLDIAFEELSRLEQHANQEVRVSPTKF
ncbi:hypothetical protein C0991_000802 [Blastosporella zonata]|nr:hypothetical protein C0991_000802 [Blastosporella zonata]